MSAECSAEKGELPEVLGELLLLCDVFVQGKEKERMKKMLEEEEEEV